MAMTSMRRRSLLAMAVLAAAMAGSPSAHADPGLAGLKVVDRETGRELPFWVHRGRLFVAGDPGSRYSLRLSNTTGGRVLVVLSVDGVNVLTGETASYDQRGYVLDPYETYDIAGWRKSNTEVAGFTFAALSQSYAARTGRPGDVGVMGMAVFRERTPPPPPVEPPIERETRRRYERGAADMAPPPPLMIPPVPAPLTRSAPTSQARAAAPNASAGAFAPERRDERREERLGTAHGAREWSVVQSTSFVRATAYPQAVRQIEYDTYANLVRRGVIRPVAYPDDRPRPFPREPRGGGFVPDPPGAP